MRTAAEMAEFEPEVADDLTPLARATEFSLSMREGASRRPPAPRPRATRVFVVANQKGGVGKTTSTVNIAAGLSSLGQRVLVNDLDLELEAPDGTTFYPWKLGQVILDSNGVVIADAAQTPGTNITVSLPINPNPAANPGKPKRNHPSSSFASRWHVGSRDGQGPFEQRGAGVREWGAAGPLDSQGHRHRRSVRIPGLLRGRVPVPRPAGPRGLLRRQGRHPRTQRRPDLHILNRQHRPGHIRRRLRVRGLALAGLHHRP
ncbi:AAA family ATPase, partial [uncultured Nocardioides sp.]|uniref:AAA family ATPase n=1 Tax=uncultured Nocardioides sp. TaxID=198441 RepID=UPI002630B908